ncbi:MAG TPA: PilZ domain-containing protein [Planctomycetota bacterium]|nr:PilZ domain-containing protein [Planctomycetota bacterium]
MAERATNLNPCKAVWRAAVLALALLSCHAAHAAIAAPDAEREKQVYDEVLANRIQAIQESRRLQKAREEEWARNEAAAMALRGSAEQERLEDVRPIELEVANAPTQQVEFGSAEVGTGAAIFFVVTGLLAFFIVGTAQHRRRRIETGIDKEAGNRRDDEALAAANQMLAERVNAEVQHMEILGAGGIKETAIITRTAGADAPANLPKWKRLGEVLVEMGVASAEDMDKAVKLAKTANEKLGHFLVHSGKISGETLCKALAKQTGLPIANLAHAEVPLKLVEKFGHSLMRRYEFVPFKDAKSTVCIAAANPLRSKVIADLEEICGKKVEVYLAEEHAITVLTDNVHRSKRSSLRRHFRVEAKLPVNYQFCNRQGEVLDETEFTGETLDLSAGGMALKALACHLPSPRDLIRQGLYIEVIISSPEGEQHDVNAIFQIRLLRKIDEADQRVDAPWLYGLELIETDDEHRERYRRLIKHLAQSKSGNPTTSSVPLQADAALGI